MQRNIIPVGIILELPLAGFSSPLQIPTKYFLPCIGYLFLKTMQGAYLAYNLFLSSPGQ
jgi:hypothetical protein